MTDSVRGSADARPNLPITTIGFHGAALIVRAGEPRAMSAPLPHACERAAPGEVLPTDCAGKREVLPDGALALVSDGYRILRGGAAQ